MVTGVCGSNRARRARSASIGGVFLYQGPGRLEEVSSDGDSIHFRAARRRTSVCDHFLASRPKPLAAQACNMKQFRLVSPNLRGHSGRISSAPRGESYGVPTRLAGANSTVPQPHSHDSGPPAPALATAFRGGIPHPANRKTKKNRQRRQGPHAPTTALADEAIVPSTSCQHPNCGARTSLTAYPRFSPDPPGANKRATPEDQVPFLRPE